MVKLLYYNIHSNIIPMYSFQCQENEREIGNGTSNELFSLSFQILQDSDISIAFHCISTGFVSVCFYIDESKAKQSNAFASSFSPIYVNIYRKKWELSTKKENQ